MGAPVAPRRSPRRQARLRPSATACASQNSRQGVRPKSTPSRRGIDRCKSLKALGIRPRCRRNRVGQSFHRWYENGTGRYSKKDPLLDPFRRSLLGPIYAPVIPLREFGEMVADLEANHYAYANGNPFGSSDPLGLRRKNCQKEGCDMVPNFLENKRRRARCECHDACYGLLGCTASSWFHTIANCLVPPIPRKPCDQCNRFVTRCFFRSFFRLNTKCPWEIPLPEELYCQNPEPPIVPPTPPLSPPRVF